MAQDTSSGSIQKMMTPEEFTAAGLNKLSPEELQKLDAWLQGYRETTEKRTEKKVKQSFFKFGEPMLSRVDGSFGGLKGRTLIKLEDGTVWKQANIDDHYGPSPIDHPGAEIDREFPPTQKVQAKYAVNIRARWQRMAEHAQAGPLLAE